MATNLQNTADLPDADSYEVEKLDQLAASLQNRVDGDVRFDQYTKMLYSTDASVFQIMPLGVVLPRNEDDVQCVLEHAVEFDVPILPRGGGSSLAGQAVGAALVMDFSRHMDEILNLNAEEGTLEVQPGKNLFSTNQKLKRHGLMVGPDPASANRATIGGCVGNNSAGSHSILYGMMVDNVLETEVFLADGSKAHFRDIKPEELPALVSPGSLEARIYEGLISLVRSNRSEILDHWPRHWRRTSGYALDRLLPPLYRDINPDQLYLDSPLVPDVVRNRTSNHLNISNLMVGSEGTLGVVTKVKMGLVPLPLHTGMAILHFDSVIDACAAVVDVLEVAPSAAELLDKQLMDLARAQPGWDQRLFFVQGDPAAVLLTEFYGDTEHEVQLQLAHLADHLKRRKWNCPITEIVDPLQQETVWELRKASLNLLMGQRGQHKPFPGIEDVSVPTEHLADYLSEILNYCGTLEDVPSTAVYAHASAGCLHVRPLLNLHTPRGVNNLKLAGAYSLELARKYNGVMSGEHGDGLARSYYNESLFTPALYNALREIKSIFDPSWRLNPGKVVDAQEPNINLRFGADYETININTVFDWRTDHGFAGAIEMCNGAGVCRKIESGTMCPSYMATREEKDSTRGRANALRNALSGRIPEQELWSESMYDVLDLCLGCKACKSECPSSVDMARIKAEFLQGFYDRRGLPLFNRLMGEMPKLLRLGVKIAPWALPFSNWMLSTGMARWFMGKIGIHESRRLPRISAYLPSTAAGVPIPHVAGRKVLLYLDTWAQFYAPEVAKASSSLLAKLGFTVQISNSLPCCGRPYISGGQVRKAKKQANRLGQALKSHVESGTAIVGVEPSCILTLRDEYLDLMENRALAEIIAANSFTLEEFLDQYEWNITEDKAKTKTPVWLHGHCHHKSLVGNRVTLSVLSKFGFSPNEINSGCCGMAGEFGYVAKHYEVSRAIGEDRLLPAVRDIPKGEALVASGFSCREQISHFENRDAIHLAELLDGYFETGEITPKQGAALNS